VQPDAADCLAAGSGGSGGATGGGAATSSTSKASASASASGSGGSDTGGSSSTGTGGSTVGCSDGEREGFADGKFASIAACAGGWSIPGVTGPPAPACNHGAGDDGANPDGAGCSAGDLCATGWHVCATAGEVQAKSSVGCAGLNPIASGFYVTGQSGPGLAQCGVGANDLFGCGDLGLAPDPSCAPLDRFSNDLCSALGPPWSCGPDNLQEATQAIKPSSAAGGVLCCTD